MPKVFAEHVAERSPLKKRAKKCKMFSEMLMNIYHKNVSFKKAKIRCLYFLGKLANRFFLQLVPSGCDPVLARKHLRAPAHSQRWHSRAYGEPPKTRAQGWGRSVSAGPAVFSYPSQKSAAQMQT